MKKLFVATLALAAAAQVQSQALFTYGSNPVMKDEFLRAYNKNKTQVADKEKSMREYLELYARFKLKVKAASEQRIDTLQQLQYDVQNFRGQVEESYLNDDKEVSRLVMEAFDRYQKDIHVLHFSIPLNSSFSGADSAKAYQTLTECRNVLLKSGDTELPAGMELVKKTDLGYITAFSLPYEMENLVYALKPGEVSTIFRTKSALHVFKYAGERPGAGKWKVAQILLAAPPQADASIRHGIEQLADSLYNVANSGADFGQLAKQYSNDKLSYMNNGELPEFGTGKYDIAFEKVVFALQKDGDISKPIATSFGYHIVKRIQQTPPATDKTDDGIINQIRQQVLQDGRIGIAKANFNRTIKIKTGFKRNAGIKDADLFRYADSVVAKKDVPKTTINKSVLFSFPKQNVTGGDWLNFVKDYKLNPDVYKGEDNKVLLQKYITTVITEYYRKHLEEYDPEFKYQMQEFKEGNMLFEIMERNVWSKAAADTAGLKKHYEAHKGKYLWSESAAVILYNCNTLKTAQQAAEAIKNGKSWKQIAEESDGAIQADSGRYELAQLQLPQNVTAKAGAITPPVVNTSDNTASFLQILGTFPGNQQRSFEEARGLVINDYQNFLEEKWVAALRKKYPVKTDEAVFQSLLK